MKKQKLIVRILVGTTHFILPIGILLLGIWGLLLLIKSRPAVPKVDRKAKATFVEVKTLHRQPYPVWISAYGSIQAHRTLVLQPQVGGRVIEQNPGLFCWRLNFQRRTYLKN